VLYLFAFCSCSSRLAFVIAAAICFVVAWLWLSLLYFVS
jgi:hypothetical protein